MLEIQDLFVKVEEKEILKGVSLSLEQGKITALMGPNGSGKSTLAYTIVGHPKYQVCSGMIRYRGEDITAMRPDIRAQKGIFLSFQYPRGIPGVSVSNFLLASYKAVKQKDMRVFAFQNKLKNKMEELNIPHSFLDRSINEGFSGGEKKKMEILQAMILEPTLLILDETDSGLDIDALKIVAQGIQKLISPERSILLITHYDRILEYITPDEVHIMHEGKMIRSGGRNLASEIEKKGFWFTEEMKDKEQPSLLVLN